MNKVARIFALAVIVIGTYSAAAPKPVSTLFGFGGPIPMCDPDDPKCTVDPVAQR